MSLIKKILPAAFGLLGIGSMLAKKPKLDLPAAPRPASRDDAEEAARRADELRRRKGGAADIITGTGGAEPSVSTGKFVPGN